MKQGDKFCETSIDGLQPSPMGCWSRSLEWVVTSLLFELLHSSLVPFVHLKKKKEMKKPLKKKK